jgi:LDH2 family malate/lactate/ureidoglycolate dehydrogenase
VLNLLIEEKGLRVFAEEAFSKVGLNREHAVLVSDVLIDADLRGVHSHGVHNLPRWARGFLHKHLNAETSCPVVKSFGATAIIDAEGTLGVIASDKAMDLAINLAKENGIGIVGVRNSSHFGPAAYFTTKALKYDQVGFCVTNGPNVMAPWGGKEPMLCNNPFSYAIPSKEEPPIILDMACSVSARGRIRSMARENQPIPEGWALNKNGEPTTDGREALEGTLSPFGAYKGYGLAVVNEALSAALTSSLFAFEIGAVASENASEEIQGHAQPAWGCGHIFGAFDISKFVEVDQFKNRVDFLSRSLKDSPKAPNTERIYLPGEIEYELKKERLVNGIPLPDGTIELLKSFSRDELKTRPFEEYCK